MTDKTAEEYVRENMAKDVAGLLEALDQLKEDLLQVNTDNIPEAQLTMLAEHMKNLRINVERSRLVTVIASALSSVGDV